MWARSLVCDHSLGCGVPKSDGHPGIQVELFFSSIHNINWHLQVHVHVHNIVCLQWKQLVLFAAFLLVCMCVCMYIVYRSLSFKEGVSSRARFLIVTILGWLFEVLNKVLKWLQLLRLMSFLSFQSPSFPPSLFFEYTRTHSTPHINLPLVPDSLVCMSSSACHVHCTCTCTCVYVTCACIVLCCRIQKMLSLLTCFTHDVSTWVC